jgi:DNA polymerase-3 subunit beta
MKFIVSSNSLQKKLQVLGGVINSSNTIPILDHFLFQLDNSKLTITSSDLETTMISSISG